MEKSRREFLTGTAWRGVAAAAAGCLTKGGVAGIGGGLGAPMYGFKVAPMKRIRVGFVGIGVRGGPAVKRVASIPGCEVTALCDFFDERVQKWTKWLTDNGYKAPKGYSGEEGWKALCDSDDVDVVYCASSWPLHLPVCVRAMTNGKHALTETPGVQGTDEAWEIVEAAEKYRRHCMLLENCCYGEEELLAHNLCVKGLLGEILHCECGYLHDQREVCWGPRYWLKPGEDVNWKLKLLRGRNGNMYPTHGFGPIARCMNINRGDRLDYLVSMETKQCAWNAFAAAKYPEKAKAVGPLTRGDINTALIRTVNDRTIYLVYNVSTPQPYSRINVLTGSKGCFRSYPKLNFGFAGNAVDPVKAYFDEAKTEELRKTYMHPIWKAAGELGKKVGGHGGMDFVMDLRWAYCLMNGLPLDNDVYDLATWSSLRDLTERSVRNRSRPVDIPDFTRGAWKTMKPFEICDMDISKFGEIRIRRDEDALKANRAEGIS